ncbi:MULTISPECIES: TolC family protein [Rufibacter]|uniref:Outer membrane protein TolC n=1 Tax=Rufibacter quisquiliarum TaxID=1549639 RepID=A0A839GK11_9BACT|nr:MULTISPECIES: TolC family protein [Rufibacter]MBA9075317.1 outer membrane protein TolC [Rufibacter quisquiliarum]
MKRISLVHSLLVGVWLGLVGLNARAADSTAVFTIEDLMRQMLVHHPVARQANQLTEQARQEIRMARGAFDPTANAKLYHKELGGKNYYTLWDNVLKVPLWVGELKAGYERNSGVNVNGENITPPQGLQYFGISVPIGQGLLLDERRATLQQALRAQEVAEAEQVKIINKLLFEAAKTYWDWAYSYQRWRLLDQSHELARVRWQAIKDRVAQGDLAAIDAVEAEMEVQNRLAQLKQALVEYQNAGLLVSNFLWGENQTPLEIPAGVIPSLAGTQIEVLAEGQLSELVATARESHPEVAKLQAKLRQLEVERRFSQNKLLPKLNLEYNLIGPGGTLGNSWLEGSYMTNNYKVGASFSMPLFLRQERGKLQVSRLKIYATQLELQQTQRENLNLVQAAFNERRQLEEQIALQEQIIANATTLRNGEQQRFENGESSLFLLNSREMSLVSQQIKLYELKAKYGKAKYYLQWAAGTMGVEAK